MFIVQAPSIVIEVQLAKHQYYLQQNVSTISLMGHTVRYSIYIIIMAFEDIESESRDEL